MIVSGSRNFTVAAVLGWASGGASVTTVGGSQSEMIGNPLKGLLSLAGQVAIEKIEAEAKEAMANLEGAVASKVDQVMGPVNDLQSKAAAVGNALGGSDPSGGLGALGGMPSPGDFAKGMLSKGGSAMEEAVTGAIDAKGRGALEALGLDPGEADGASEANKAGVDGAAGGNSASNSACGPGHSITKVTASSAESVSGTKLVLSAGKVVTNVTAARTTNVGSVQVDLALGSRVETCSASKKESSVGLVSVVAGDEVEEVGGSRTIKVGGAIAEKISGGATVSAGGILAMAGAYWKIDASGSIVLSCGAAKVTIGGGGIEIAAPAITITAPKIEMPATVAED
jgi:type VI secretion system secreted protein VgrG